MENVIEWLREARGEIIAGLVLALLGWLYSRYRSFMKMYRLRKKEFERMENDMFRFGNSKKEIESLQEALKESEAQRQDVKKQLEATQQELQRKDEELRESEAKSHEASRRIEELQSQLETSQTELQRRDEALKESETQRQNVQSQIETLQQELQRKDEALRESETQRQNAQNQLETTQQELQRKNKAESELESAKATPETARKVIFAKLEELPRITIQRSDLFSMASTIAPTVAEMARVLPFNRKTSEMCNIFGALIIAEYTLRKEMPKENVRIYISELYPVIACLSYESEADFSAAVNELIEVRKKHFTPDRELQQIKPGANEALEHTKRLLKNTSIEKLLQGIEKFISIVKRSSAFIADKSSVGAFM